MMKMTPEDIAYYRKHLEEAKKLHTDEYDGRIDPKKYVSYYSGDEYEDDQFAQDVTADGSFWISNNKLMPATNRVTPTFYWQNPRIVFKPRKGTSQFSADLLTADINYEYKELKLKKLNQTLILDGWYKGFGVCKIGYSTQFQKIQGPEGKPDTGLDDTEYIESEGLFVSRIKPENWFADPRSEVGEDKLIWVKYNKTLADVTQSSMYPDIDKKFIEHFKGRKDDREVNLEIYEGWELRKDGVYIIVFCEGWAEPIRYDKSSWLGDGLPFSYLSFAEVVDCKYPPSFMKIAFRTQQQISYLSTLQGKIVDKFRVQTGINEQALTEEGKRTLDSNEFGAVVKFKSSPMGQIQEIVSGKVPTDLYQLIADQQANLQEILNASGLQLGSAESQKTLGQDQIIQAGNDQGITGIQDKVREFVIDQATKMSQFLKQYATSQKFVPLVGMRVKNPFTGEQITDEWIEFGTENNPTTLKDAIAGDHDVECDIKSASPQNEMMKLQLALQLTPVLKSLEPDLAIEGEKVVMPRVARMILGAYKEVLPESEHVIERMTDEERAALEAGKQQAIAEQRAAMQNQKDMAALDQLQKATMIRKQMEAPVGGTEQASGERTVGSAEGQPVS